MTTANKFKHLLFLIFFISNLAFGYSHVVVSISGLKANRIDTMNNAYMLYKLLNESKNHSDGKIDFLVKYVHYPTGFYDKASASEDNKELYLLKTSEEIYINDIEKLITPYNSQTDENLVTEKALAAISVIEHINDMTPPNNSLVNLGEVDEDDMRSTRNAVNELTESMEDENPVIIVAYSAGNILTNLAYANFLNKQLAKDLNLKNAESKIRIINIANTSQVSINKLDLTHELDFALITMRNGLPLIASREGCDYGNLCDFKSAEATFEGDFLVPGSNKHSFIDTYLSDHEIPAQTTTGVGHNVPYTDGKTTFRDRFEDLVYTAANSFKEEVAQPYGVQRISVSNEGLQASDSSTDPDISADGRFVTYSSSANNLVDNDAYSGNDVFLYDRITNNTIIIPSNENESPNNISSGNPSISDDGTYLLFLHESVGSFTGSIYDKEKGETRRIIKNGNTFKISGDGNHIVYKDSFSSIFSSGTYLYQNIHGNIQDIKELPIESRNFNHPSLSKTGKYIAYSNYDQSSLTREVYIYNNTNGDINVISRKDSNTTEESNNSRSPSISSDGRYIAFESEAINLIDNYVSSGDSSEVYLYDTVDEIHTLISTRNSSVLGYGGKTPSISGDGRYVAFVSSSNNFTEDDDNNLDDVFVHDRITKETILVSRGINGKSGNSISENPAISDDGKYVTFVSYASDLIEGDTNNSGDIFLRELE